MRRLVVSVLAASLTLSPALAEARESKDAKGRKPRMAVLDFPAASGGWSCSGWNQSERRMSNVLRDLFTTEIGEAADGKVRVVERERLKDIRGELSFQQSGEVDGATAQRIGKLLGVRYLLSGKITRFACKKSGAATGWGVGALVGKMTKSNLAGDVAGSVKTAKMKFSGRVDARLIDVQSGEILGTFKDEEETADSSVKIAGGGTHVDYDEELVNKVYEPIVQRIAPKLVKKIGEVHEENLAEDAEDDAPVAKRKKSAEDDDEEDAAPRKKRSKASDEDEDEPVAKKRSKRGGGDDADAGAAGKAAKPAKLELYGNDFDFVPGDRVLFFDDFSDTEVGDSPMRWRGKGLEVVEAQGRRWVATKCSWQQVRYEVKGDLPKKFTVEFDVVIGEGNNYTFWIDSGVGKYRVSASGTDVAGDSRRVEIPRGLQHVAISFSDTYVKMYVGGKRVGQNTDGVKRPIKVFGIHNCDGKDRSILTSFRLAEGGKDYATELTTGGRIVTHGITFDSGSDRIRPESGPTLHKILKALQANESVGVEIQGHTDSQGGDPVNVPLSERRALAVRAWLVSEGIDERRLTTKGLGATKPLESNDTPEGRANNRRVEFVKTAGT